VSGAAHLFVVGVRLVTGRIGGHRFERFVGPPGRVLTLVLCGGVILGPGLLMKNAQALWGASWQL
jgi:hypothetical protein